MIRFLKQQDELGNLINEACNRLMSKIQTLRLDDIAIEPFFKEYFIKCHFTRPVFSLKTSASLLYGAIVTSNKSYKDQVVMDYGAGLGTLYLLAKMIGMKKVIYNDLMPAFVSAARAIDKALGYEMDEYIEGDVLYTCQQLQAKHIQCDIITSRNVVEHIYSLRDFFNTIYNYQPNAVIYNSTTANWRNPAAHLQHVLIHRKHRPEMVQRKMNIIREMVPSIAVYDAKKLATLLLPYGGIEFTNAIENYKLTQQMPPQKKEYTNFCEENGNWGEHLLPFKSYIQFAPQYNVSFKPGFWDENYSNKPKQLLGKFLNTITSILGNQGVITSSFIYIIAVPKPLKKIQSFI